MTAITLPTKENSITLEEWRCSPDFRSLYIWHHVTADNRPFYVGRGRGATAWESSLGPLWEKFVTDYLGGEYYVVVSCAGLTDEESAELVEGSMAQYHSTLLNRANFHRPCNLQAIALQRSLRAELQPLYNDLKGLRDRTEIIALCRKAISLQRKLDEVQIETGLYGEILSTFPTTAVNMYFIKPLVEALLDEGLKDEAAADLEHFLQCKGSANFTSSATIIRLKKQVLAGMIRRRVAR